MSFSKNKTNQLTQSDYKELVNDVTQDKAYPELKFKWDMLDDLHEFNVALYEFKYSYIVNNRKINLLKKAKVEISLLRVFNNIKFMVAQKKAWNINYDNCMIESVTKEGKKKRRLGSLCDVSSTYHIVSDFELIELLDTGERNLGYKDIIKLKNYVFWCFHVINLTNLLKNDRNDFIKELRNDYSLGDVEEDF